MINEFKELILVLGVSLVITASKYMKSTALSVEVPI